MTRPPPRPRVGGAEVAVVAALALARALELLHSRRNLGRAGPAGPGPAAAPRSYPLMVATHAALFTVPLARRWHRSRPPAAVRWTAGGLVAGATLLRLWSIATLGRWWNAEGRVAPELVPVRRGPYRHCRHPNYVAVAVEFLALPLLLGAPREAVWLSLADAAVLWPRIRGEERRLLALPAYRLAFADTPRFIPGLGPRRRAAAPTAGDPPPARR